MWPLRGGLSGQYHALVVIGVDPESVTVLDPQHGEYRLPQEDLHKAWAAMRLLTIVSGA
jgi:predicted double-glycine peptidase